MDDSLSSGEAAQARAIERATGDPWASQPRRYFGDVPHHPLVRLDDDDPADPVRRARRLCSRCSVIARVPDVPLCGRCDELLFYALNLGPLPSSEINHASSPGECALCKGWWSLPPADGSAERFCARHRELSTRPQPTTTRPEYSDDAPAEPHTLPRSHAAGRHWFA